MSSLTISALLVASVIIALSHYHEPADAAPAAKRMKCDAKEDKKMEKDVGYLLTIGTDRRYPINTAELKAYCKDQFMYLERVEQYKSACLKGEVKNLAAVLIYSIKAGSGGYCKAPNSKRVTEFLKSAPCANKVSATGYQQCQREVIERIWAAEKLPSAEKIPQICCAYFDIPKCMARVTKGVPECTEKHLELHHTFLKTFFSSVIDVLCGDYNDHTDKCDHLKPVQFKAKGKVDYPISFYAPIVKVLANL